jgi:ABC-2 type transport system permease protein
VAREHVAELPRDRMLGTVFAKTLRDQRRSYPWWVAGLVGTVLMYASVWPSVAKNATALEAYIEQLPAVLKELIGSAGGYSTPEGYLGAEFFSFLGPILLLVYAIGAGARAIAGEEEAGSLDLLLSTPVRRRRVLLDKFEAMALGTFGLVLVAWLSVIALGPIWDLSPDPANFTAACLHLLLLALAFGAIALAVGSTTGSKGLAIGAPSGVALVTFLVNVFGATVSWLEPIRPLSPFYYYSGSEPLLNGVDPVHALVLGAVTAVAVLVALWRFERRDLAA